MAHFVLLRGIKSFLEDARRRVQRNRMKVHIATDAANQRPPVFERLSCVQSFLQPANAHFFFNCFSKPAAHEKLFCDLKLNKSQLPDGKTRENTGKYHQYDTSCVSHEPKEYRKYGGRATYT